ncbi:hypothetical protein ACWKSP_31140 [Micromonosporaceae bacterium Da 78-11]
MHDRYYQSYVRALRIRGRTDETIKLYGRAYAQLRLFTDTPLPQLSRLEQGVAKPDLAILRVMSEAGGPRRGEVGNVRVDDVNWGSSLIRLSGKTGERRICFGDSCTAVLSGPVGLEVRLAPSPLGTGSRLP